MSVEYIAVIIRCQLEMDSGFLKYFLGNKGVEEIVTKDANEGLDARKLMQGLTVIFLYVDDVLFLFFWIIYNTHLMYWKHFTKSTS